MAADPLLVGYGDRHEGIKLMKNTFVHISDVHFRPRWHEEAGLVCKAFLTDLRTRIQPADGAYLVLSGDIVFEGGNAGMIDGFMSEFSSSLDDIGIPRERRICVPGNHDVSRAALKPRLPMHIGAISMMDGEASFNDQLPELTRMFFHDSFAPYIACEGQFAKHTCCGERLGGHGWTLSPTVGVYCLNTALTSVAGMTPPDGKSWSDCGRLCVDTRTLYQWVDSDKSPYKILVMHHPIDWLAPWAADEIQAVADSSFQLTMLGHTHKAVAKYTTRGRNGSIYCVAPPLFTKKSDVLGYAIINIDTATGETDIQYRQYAHGSGFVAGAVLAGNDQGRLLFRVRDAELGQAAISKAPVSAKRTVDVLQEEFEAAVLCYSSKKCLWVERDLASVPETSDQRTMAHVSTNTQFVTNIRSCIIRAPQQFGLTSLARRIALDYHRQSAEGKVLIVLDAGQLPADERGLEKAIGAVCHHLRVAEDKVAGFVFDKWSNDKHSIRVLNNLEKKHKESIMVCMYCAEDCMQLGSALRVEDRKSYDTLYLWALTRQRVRELTSLYLGDLEHLDDDIVTERIVADMDVMNVHRTPMNCLLLLKYAEDAFDESPVNRTEMIGRVLYLLFHQYNKVPRYATKPDIKDCEYALGYLCEGMVRKKKTMFSKAEFTSRVGEYCRSQLVEIDIEALFAFLVSENIVVKGELEFSFRYAYWLHFFAAHRMHHDVAFRDFILSERRYAAFPELAEFYAGIDRRRVDAVRQITADLRLMNSELLARTGIPPDFNPLALGRWDPSPEDLEGLRKAVSEGAAESALPVAVKDAIADKNYDAAKPYRQALAEFIDKASLHQLMQAMRGAARTLRNSDHVGPEEKMDLLGEVLACWKRVSQVLIVISPVLAAERRAVFEDACFVLADNFTEKDPQAIWQAIMGAVMHNVVQWYQEDLFSRKMGPLLASYGRKHAGDITEALLILAMIKQRPPGWEREVERFIVAQPRSGFYLAKAFEVLYDEFRHGFASERARQNLRRLAGMAVAKHETGAKHPNRQLVEKGARAIEENPK